MRLRVRSHALASALALGAAAALAVDPGAATAAPAGSAEPSALRELRLEPLDGNATTLGALLDRGPVLVDFWATWCKPCVAAIPGLVRLQDAYAGRGFTVVGVSVDGPRNFAKVRPFVRRLRMDYPVVLDEDGSLARFFQVSSVPAAFLLDGEGRIVHVLNGYRPGEEKALEEALKPLLGDAAE